ncbi:hypothetical protein MMC19_002898 [Ptychographa xylographoides]|nr:hypothetical protein [Ptychographa xylographoides]
MGPHPIAHCTFLIARKEGISFADFETEYLQHIPKAVPVLQKYGATYYNVVSPSTLPFLEAPVSSVPPRPLPDHHPTSSAQSCIPQQFNAPSAKTASIAALSLDDSTASRIVLEHDAIATIKFPSVDHLKRFMESPENKECLAPEGPRYTNELKQRLSIGTEWLAIEGGVSLL